MQAAPFATNISNQH